MKVKTKLYLSVFVGLGGLAVVGIFSLVGMKFVGNQIHLLTEKSTPAQLKTIDFQRALQEHTSNLLRIEAAATIADFNKAREDADRSLADITKVSGELAALKGDSAVSASGKGQLTAVSDATRQIVQTTGEKIAAATAAAESLKTMNAQLQTMSKKLSALDESIRKVQIGSTSTLASTNKSVAQIGFKQKNIQTVKDYLKDMKLAIMEMNAADTKNEILVARNHFNTSWRFLMGNEIVKTSQSGAGKLLADSLPNINKAVMDKGGLVETRTALIATPNEEESKKFGAAMKQVMQKVTNLLSDMEARIEVTTAEVASENEKFGNSLKGTNVAGNILMLNSQLTALGSTIEGRVGLLFGVQTIPRLEQIRGDLQEKLSAAEKITAKEEDLLKTANLAAEAKALDSVASSLSGVRTALLSRGGVVEKLRGALTVEEKAVALRLKIREMVDQQREEGKKGVSVAQGEQEKTVLAVNRIVRTSTLLIAVLGIACLVIGTLLGGLLVRSITKQIRSLSCLAESFREGDLTARMDDTSKDEFGTLASQFNQTSVQLNDMVHTISDAVMALTAGSEELAASAEEISASATEVTAMTMTNSDNATRTNGLMAETLSIIERSNAAMRELTAAMTEIGNVSEEAGRIVKTSNMIATQTNLLALNAAVEAAHAGAAGDGFAVVAAQVKNLAERANEAARNTEELIRKIVQKIRQGSDLVASTNDAFQKVVSITGAVGELVSGITAASKEQVSGINEISQGVSEITRVSQLNSDSAQGLTSAIAMFKTT